MCNWTNKTKINLISNDTVVGLLLCNGICLARPNSVQCLLDVGLGVKIQLVGIIHLHYVTWIDGAEGAVEANPMGSRVAIIRSSVSSSECVNVYSFDHSNVVRFLKLL